MVQKHVYTCSTQHVQFQHSKGAEEEIEQWALTSEAQQQHAVVSSTIRTSLFRHFTHKTIKLFLIYCHLFSLINFLTPLTLLLLHQYSVLHQSFIWGHKQSRCMHPLAHL